jgi:hypothetical protein
MAFKEWSSKSKRRFLALLITSVFFALCFGIAGYGFLRSSYVQKRILASIRQPLNELGVELKFDDFEVDVFAGFNFVNLKLKIDTPPLLKADLAIEKARLSYGFWALIRQQLRLDNATLKGLNGSITLTLPKAKELQSKKELSLSHFIGLIKSPNFTLAIPNVDVSDIKLHVALTQGENFTEFDIQETDASAQLSLQPSALKLRLSASVIASARRSLVKTEANNTTNSKTTLGFERVNTAPNLSLEITTPGNDLNINLELAKSTLELDGLVLTSLADQSSASTDIRMKKFNVTSSLNLVKNGAINPAAGWRELLKSLKTTGQVNLSANSLNAKQVSQINNKPTSNLIALGSFNLKKNWDVHLDENSTITNHTWSVDNSTDIKNLDLSSSNSPQTSIDSASLVASSTAKDGKSAVKYLLTMNQITNKLFGKPLSLQQPTKMTIDLEQSSLNGEMSATVNGSPIVSAMITGRDHGTKLTSNLKVKTSSLEPISEVISGLKILSKISWPETTSQVALSIEHPMPWADFNQERWHELTVDVEAQVTATPATKTTQPSSISFNTAKIAAKSSLAKRPPNQNQNKFQSQLTLELSELKTVQLTSPASVKAAADLKAELGKKSLGSTEMEILANDESFLKMNFDWNNSPKLFLFDQKIDVKIPTKLIKSLRNAELLSSLGALSLQGNHNLEVQHPRDSIINLKESDISKIALKAKLAQILEQKSAAGGKNPIIIRKPLKVQSSVALVKSALEFRSNLNGSSVAYGKLAEVTGLTGDLIASLNNFRDPSKALFEAKFDVKQIDFLTSKVINTGFDRSLQDLSFKTKSSLDNDKITINTVEAGLKDGTIMFQGSGAFSTSGTGQLDGDLTSKLLTESAIVSGSGEFKSPIKLIMFDKQRLSLEATPAFNNFNITVGDFTAKNVNGELKILEELQIDKDGKIGFLYLKTQNPFARVDYENVEPYVEQKSRLTFDEVRWKHIIIGPMIQSFEMRQNLVLLNDLKMDLLDGSMVGRFYVDLHPSRLRTGFLGRFSGIKPELLKAPDRRGPAKDWASFGGRMAVDFDMRKRLASGRMDFTQIGKRQLLSLLDALDPDFKDNQISMARKGLKIAYPKKVGINMDHGLMDLSIDLAGALSQSVGVRSLPLSGLINSQAGEALSTIETMIN